MVKGISRQVIVVHSPEPELFEQAIFIIKEGQREVTDEVLLKEARKLMNSGSTPKVVKRLYGPVWACCGALLTGALWLLTNLL